MGATLVRRTWHGDELIARARRAGGRAIIGMGEGTSVEMKRAAHVLSGDLRRSVHTARAESGGEINVTEPGPDLGAPVAPGAHEAALLREDDWIVEVGSWLEYACVENDRGGAHRFADIGYELARADFDVKLVRAWAEEGLR